MEYFKITKALADSRRNRKDFSQFVENELYTQKELSKLNVQGVDIAKMQRLNISRKRTYFFFGARFESKK